MSIRENLIDIKKTLPNDVTLVAVSKTKPLADLMEAYDSGQRVFGENKVQEMVEKQAALPKDIEWHMIGHVQRNKVKYMASFVSLIHAVDSERLLKEINKQAKNHNRVINCLLQIKIAKEDSKFGMTFTAAKNMLTSAQLKDLKHVKIVGLMGMATFTEDMSVVAGEFKFLKQCYDQLLGDGHEFNILSMGMSGDFQLAIELGSNMVRIGSNIFGARNYN
jgi:pyridoxal phosphate enzyme (YggS family)